MNMVTDKWLKRLFGGEGPKENERRYLANQDLRSIADRAEPWTVEGLKKAVREWLEDE